MKFDQISAQYFSLLLLSVKTIKDFSVPLLAHVKAMEDEKNYKLLHFNAIYSFRVHIYDNMQAPFGRSLQIMNVKNIYLTPK